MTVVIDPAVGVELAQDAVTRARRAGADEAKVNHQYRERFEVNFDTSDVTLVRSTVTDSLSVMTFVGGCRGSAELNGRSHDEVDRAVADAVAAARAGHPDTANVLPVGDPEPARSDDAVEADHEAMVDAVVHLLDEVHRGYPTIRIDSSHYSFTTGWHSYADSNGRHQQARRSNYDAQMMVTGKDGTRTTSFNYGGASLRDHVDDLGSLVPLRRLLDDTVASFDPRPVPSTFVGDVIFMPESMMTLAGSVAGAVSGGALIRNASPFLERLGEQVAAPCFSLLHRPSALAHAAAFDADGFAATDLDVIRDGVLADFVIDWYSAQRLGRPMTTGTLSLVVPAGETPLDDVISGTERGVLLGRFSGGRPNPNLDFSGVAKNSFFVEDGRVVGPVAETMIAGNFCTVLERIRAISQETVDFGYTSAPWVAAGGVTVSTK